MVWGACREFDDALLLYLSETTKLYYNRKRSRDFYSWFNIYTKIRLAFLKKITVFSKIDGEFNDREENVCSSVSVKFIAIM